MTDPTGARPSVLFVCIHNAGRSQMAAAYTRHLSGGAVEVRSAGSEPADQVNPSAVAAMAEEGIDITAELPKILTTDAVKVSDVVITMGCGDTCPIFPGQALRGLGAGGPRRQGCRLGAPDPRRDQGPGARAAGGARRVTGVGLTGRTTTAVTGHGAAPSSCSRSRSAASTADAASRTARSLTRRRSPRPPLRR